ncbi:hypothetical protein BDZ94DRAFT_1250737 [Collybia nuda]|uniref:DUF6533 domain-containing protein n=1 Tax=Collybia nuda TaxID=64659 RepID=A0A9P5YF96_9AGAR|nr:hypothetical protein BDZ94DRAFT_1250737 [Collybia nuda]
MAQNPEFPDLGQVGPLSFIAAAGVVTLLYDHLLTFDQEVRYVWKAKWTVPKFLFLLIRYVVPCAVALTTYQLGGIFHKNITLAFCRRWFGASALMCLITTGPGHFLVMLWSWILCERNRQVMLGMLGLFAAAQVFSIGFCIFSVVQTSHIIGTVQKLNFCVLERRSVLPYLFIPGLLCEGIGLLAVFWKSLESRKDHIDLVDAHCEEGAPYVLVLFVMQLANLLITLYIPPYLIFVCMPFTWSVTNITVTRLILNLRKHALDRRMSAQSVSCETPGPRVHFADQ